MKRIYNVILITAILYSGSVSSQIIAPTKYDSGIYLNYIRTWEANAPITNADSLLVKPLKDVGQMTAYVDGLGRPLQTVIKKGSMITGDSARDLVTPIVYDELGNETYNYLPFVANNTGSNTSISNGLFKLNPFQQDSTFNKAVFTDETYFYSKTVFEPSPVNRVLEKFAPGNSWVGTSGQTAETSRTSSKVKYWFNKTADSVKIWNVSDVNNTFGTYETSGNYTAGKLYKILSLDENNKQIIEFKDKDGRLILQKKQLTADPDTGLGKGYDGWICTYYIYDNLSNLRCVIQPKGVQILSTSSWTVTTVILDELCYRYEYDRRGRQIIKKFPGAGRVYMVYDARDRLIMMQDSLMRAENKWLYSQYDGINRIITTGTITDNSHNASYHRDHADTSISYPNIGDYTNEPLTKLFYDDYDWRSNEGNPLSNTRNTGFDSYLQTSSNTQWPYPQSVQQSTQLRGLVTGTKTKVLGSSSFLYGVQFYDDKARLIQTQKINITGSTDIQTNQYCWNGQPLLTIFKNEKAAPNSQTTIELTRTTYDDLWRISKIEKRVSNSKVNSGNMPAGWTTICQNEYNSLSQLKTKKLGTNLDSLKFEYNIRGWSLGMNRNYVKDTASVSNYFGYDIGYDKANFTINGLSKSYSASQYSGSITGILWKSTGDDQLRKYDFTYDPVNRLLGADFNQLTNTSFSKAAGIDFSVNGLSYDVNGNIATMNQKGWKLGGSVTIDSLLYTYNSNTNKLLNVLDRKNDTTTLLGDFRSSAAYMAYLSQTKTTAAADYQYDGNANLGLDKNKDISFIHYNLLNLPDSIVFTGRGKVIYTYDADGNKLKKVTTQGSNVNSVLYLFGNYVNDTLQFIGNTEGRIRPKDSSVFVYDYFVRDHLGNVRVLLTEQKDTSFYPPASMETDLSTFEEALYSNVSATRVKVPDGYPEDTYTDPNKSACQVDTTQTVGVGIVLKVMAGDKFNFRVSSWYSSSSSGWGVVTSPLTDIVNALSNGIGGITNGHSGPTSGVLQSSGVLEPGITTFLNNRPTNSHRVKAYVNWLLFDEQFNMVAANSGAELVGDFDEFTVHTHNNMPVDKNGYLYIFVSNDNLLPVYFDNLQVTHIRGPLLEETHYYPFGLAMAGISDKALAFGNPSNKLKFNAGSELASREFNDGAGLELYETPFRSYDPQIGRFHQLDLLSSMTYESSGYVFGQNNPILRNDPSGLKDTVVNGEKGETKQLENFTVVSRPKLKGGPFDGTPFGDVKTFDHFGGGSSSMQTKTAFTNEEILARLTKSSESLKRIGANMEAIGAFTGGKNILTAVKEFKTYKDFIKKLKEGKINPATVALLTVAASALYLEGKSLQKEAQEIAKIVDTYVQLHSSAYNTNPAPAKGIYEITYMSVSGGTGGAGYYSTTSYYDVATKQFLGGITSRN